MLNRRVHPVVPEKGSVGASGDLAPLAHLALSVIGEGEAFFEGQRMPSEEALTARAIEASATRSEGRPGSAQWHAGDARSRRAGAFARETPVAHLADVSGAMSLEALKGTPAAFDPTSAGCAAAPGTE